MTRPLIVLAIAVVLLSLIAATSEIDRAWLGGASHERRMPEFALPGVLDPRRVLRSTQITAKVSLVNIWATWCVPCRREHGMLMRVSRESGVPIFGLNFRDQRADARRWLESLGDPYRASGFDAEGVVARQLDVYGLPETLVIDADGRIAYRHVGALSEEVWRLHLQPSLARLRQATP